VALSHAILAALLDAPLSGYDLAKQFDSSVGLFWSATHPQIYQELANLETQGWVEVEVIAQSRPLDKKVYQITPSGRQLLAQWLTKPCKPLALKDELLLKVRLAYLGDPQTVVNELKRHRQLHLKKLSIYQDIERQRFQNSQEVSFDAQLRYLALLRGISAETAWLSWCDQALQILESAKGLPENKIYT